MSDDKQKRKRFFYIVNPVIIAVTSCLSLPVGAADVQGSSSRELNTADAISMGPSQADLQVEIAQAPPMLLGNAGQPPMPGCSVFMGAPEFGPLPGRPGMPGMHPVPPPPPGLMRAGGPPPMLLLPPGVELDDGQLETLDKITSDLMDKIGPIEMKLRSLERHYHEGLLASQISSSELNKLHYQIASLKSALDDLFNSGTIEIYSALSPNQRTEIRKRGERMRLGQFPKPNLKSQ